MRPALLGLILAAGCAVPALPSRPAVSLTPAAYTEPMDTLVIPRRCKGPVIPIDGLVVNGRPYRDTLMVLTIDCDGAFRRYLEKLRLYDGPPGRVGGGA